MGEGLTPLLWCIDVEPDMRIIDGHRPALWKGYEASVALFGELLLSGQIPFGDTLRQPRDVLDRFYDGLSNDKEGSETECYTQKKESQ